MSLTPRIDKLQANYIINGNFDFWQRNTSFTASGYGPDRWHLTVAGTCTHTRETSDVPPGSNYASKWTAGASSSYGQHRQFIERATVVPMRGKTFTVSYLVKMGVTFTSAMSIEVGYSTVTDNISGFSAISLPVSNLSTPTSTTSFVKVKGTFTVPNDAVGLYIGLVPQSVQSSGAYVIVGQVVLNEGDLPDTEFSLAGRDYANELALCHRYYWNNTDSNISVASGGMYTDTAGRVWLKFPVQMRAVPTMNIQSLLFDRIGVGGVSVASVANIINSIHGSTWDGIGFPGGTTFGRPIAYTGAVSADAEL